ncbi:MAG: hypothetical protein C7N36_18245 [Bacteroidetes bacterium]|nr:MAG: hypothetical protein C7N36_18245 [Bacteroidota bacterium]
MIKSGSYFLLAPYLEDGQKPKINVFRTRAIDGEYGAPSGSIDHAEVRLYHTQGLVADFHYVSDTSRRYEIAYGVNIDGSTFIDTQKVEVYLDQYYTSAEALNFEVGEQYWMEVKAEGFPDLVSDPVVFKDEISATDFRYTEPFLLEGTEEEVLVFEEVGFMLQKRGLPAERRVRIIFNLWNGTKQWLSDNPAGSYGLEIQAVEQTYLPVLTNQPIVLYPDSDRECFNSCILVGSLLECRELCAIPAEGVAVVLSTFDEKAMAYQDAFSENGNYIGGFFPPNPGFPHTVSGGYGIFTFVEKDTFILQ